MKLTNHEWLRAGEWLGLLSIVMGLTGMGMGSAAHAQAVSTTTVQGTVYLANGQPGAGTLVLSWPSFTTASGQLVAADSTTVTIAPDGFVSVNLAPNLGATPAGQYYTAVYYLSDGTTSTQYWVVPTGAQATLGQVQSQLMPAAQAVQTVSKAYVDQAIASLAGGILTVTGATMTGPLTLCCDPTQPLQAADKHYVDENVGLNLPLTGGTLTGPLTSVKLGALYQVDQFSGADFGAKLGACLSGLSQTQGGTCDARNFSGTLSMGSNLTISTGNATVQLPCATISTGNQIIVTAGTRNVSLRGCALRGASTASGSQGGTVFLYSGTGAMVQVGDPTYVADTMGFHLDNAVINTTSAASATAQGFLAYRTQELDLESLYFLGNSNQTGMTLDGTGNYTGGSFYDDEFTGFQTAVNAIGHQISNPATTDWLNASTFMRLHIDCPTSGGSPISGSYGINLQQGDGNTITGGDIEGCSTALHLGANAQNNTIVGLRNENSTNQVVADAGSAYNNWMTGGTMFTGALTDNGTRNSFLDTFHRSSNGLNGDWYGSQKDATVTNHYRIGIGAGNERGLLNRYQTDYGYRWTMGLSDATAGEQFYEILDELNNVYRVSIGQYNNGQSSTNNQTVINSAGTGAVVLNGSNNSGTGGVVIGSGGASETTVATINNAGNAQFNGTLQVGGTSTFIGTPTVKNQADAEIDATLWAGLTASQKESFIYKDWNGNSQWYMEKDASNNWELNSATGGLDSFKAYQSTNSGDTYIDASNSSGTVRINYETGAGTAFNIYGGGSSSLYASFTGTTSIKFPGLAASSGHNCLQIDNSGYITNTSTACGTGGGNGTVNAGTSGQIAYYSAAGTTLSGISTVPVTAGGTGAATAAGALTNLGAVSTATTVNGHALGSNVTVSASDLTTGTLPHAQMPSLVNGDIPNNAANTTGNAATATNLATQVTGLLNGNGASAPGTATSHNESLPANCSAASGSGTAYTCSTSPVFTPAAGDHIQFRADVANTGTATLAVNGASAASIKKWGASSGLTANDLLAGHWISATFDGANWQLEGQLGNANATQINSVSLSGLATGILKNTNSTGVPTIAVAGTDYIIPSGSITGNAATATNVPYSGLTGIVPTWNQNTTGTAVNVTGTVLVGNGGTGATTAAGAMANLLPGVTSNGANGVVVAGNAQLNGTLQVSGVSTFSGTPTVENQADAEIDATLWAGLTTSQKESLIFKDWNGNSQWYMLKDANNNWALNSATGGLDSFKAYQSTNSGDTYIDASNSSGTVRINYETGAGTAFNIYGGGSSSLYASFTGTTSIKFPGLAASSGHNCLQIDNSGYITNTGAACGTGSSNGTVNAGTSGQIAYYSGTGTAISGTNTISIAAGGTGASSASGALANLGGASITGAAFTGPVSAPSVIASTVAAGATAPSGFVGGALNDLILTTGPWIDPRAYGNNLQAACNAAIASGSGEVRINSTVTVSSTVVCGYVATGSQQIAPTIHIANGGHILCSMTNNTDCIDAFAVNCDGGAPGGVPGGAVPYASIFLTPTAVVRNVVGPVDQTGLQESIGVDGCTISANAGGGAIVTHAVVDLSETFNTSTFTNSTVEQWSSGTPGSYTPGVVISVVPGGVNNGIGAFLLKNLYLDAANTPTEYDAGVVIDGTQNSSLHMNEITLEQVKVEGTTIPGLKVTSGLSGQIWGLHVTDSHFTGTNPNIELDGATDSIFDNLDCVGPNGMTCVHMGDATNETNSGNEFRHIRSHNGVSNSIGCFIQDDSASGSCSLALPGNYEQTWGLPDTTTGGADINQNPLSVPLVNVKSSTGFQVNGTPISSANLSDGPSASAASNFSGNLVTGASGSRALSDSGISASKAVLNTGCGSTQSRCLYLAGLQSPTTTSTNPVTLTGSTYTLPANTLTGSGCLDILFSASHSTGTTTSTVSLYVGSQAVSGISTTATGHLVIRATYCNTTGTGAGGQTSLSEASYLSGSLSPTFQSFSQASTSALAISLQVADATSTDAWKLETMKVQLEQ
jgi:uncharacterized protein YfdQ (DUF2303 family)